MKRRLAIEAQPLFAQLTHYTKGLPVEDIDFLINHCNLVLRDIYAEKAGPITVAFFVEGHDIWQNHILSRLTYLMPLVELIKLCQVCKLWHRDIALVKHIHIDHSSWNKFEYERRVFSKFVNLCSIRADEHVLQVKSEAFSRIESLFLDNDIVYCWELENILLWTNLRTLAFPEGTRAIKSIEMLTQLTSLDARVDIFNTEEDLGKLTNLTQLRIRELDPGYYTLIQSLTNLTSLDSDCYNHFIGFTGQGCVDEDDNDIMYDWPFSELFYARTSQITMTGKWLNGQFTGCVQSLSYQRASDANDIDYSGNMINNEMHGHGCETNQDTSIVYEGEWSHNKRHGLGIIYKWEGRALDEKVYKYHGRWENDNLIEQYINTC